MSELFALPSALPWLVLAPALWFALTALDRSAELRAAGASRELRSTVPTLFGDAATVVAEVAESAAPGAEARTTLETLVLVRGAGGWIIRHLHRSTR